MTEKKIRAKIPFQNKVRSELQKEINSVCPICANEDVGHFQIHHIDENPSNNDLFNLILLCPTCHSKATKGDYSPLEIKNIKVRLLPPPKLQPNTNSVVFNSKVENAIVGNNNSITIKQAKKIVQKYPESTIGFDPVRSQYIGRLIDRYNTYKESEVGKANMKYAVIFNMIKKHFLIPTSRAIYSLQTDKFDALQEFIKNKINNTKLAKIKGPSHKNYSSFEEFRHKLDQKS